MTSQQQKPFNEPEMLELARNAVGKVDRLGQRGATLVTMDEIIAMATTLACLGIVPPQPTKEGASGLLLFCLAFGRQSNTQVAA